MKRGQVLSVDIIIALIGFMAIVVFLIWGWQAVSFSITSFDETQDLYSLAYFTSESLIKSHGNPVNWYEQSTPSRSSIYSLGLANGSYISYQKISQMATLNNSYYTNYKEILGVLGPNYDLQIEYYFDNGTDFVIDNSLTFGQVTNTETLVSFSRLFILDNSSKTPGRMLVKISGGDS